jgi:hypothetical protein
MPTGARLYEVLLRGPFPTANDVSPRDSAIMKNALLTALITTMLAASSGCCGALRCVFCCHDGGPYAYGGGCGSCDSGCYDDCGGCGSCESCVGGGGIIDWLFACHHGDCGPAYWGEFCDKPDLYDPCDGCGNWTGHGCGGGGCGDCGGCGSNYYPYNSGYGGGDSDGYSQGFDGEFDGAVSDVQVHEGPAAEGTPTPAVPRTVEPIPVPNNRSGHYRSRSSNRRVAYDAPQCAPRSQGRSELRR